MKVHNVNRSGAIVPHFSNIPMFFRDWWLRKSEEKSSWNWNIGGHLNQFEDLPLGCSTSDSSEHIWVKQCRWNVCLWISPYVIAYHTRVMKATKILGCHITLAIRFVIQLWISALNESDMMKGHLVHLASCVLSMREWLFVVFLQPPYELPLTHEGQNLCTMYIIRGHHEK